LSHDTDVILLQDLYLARGGSWEKDRLALVNEHLSKEQGVGVLISVNDEQCKTITDEGRPYRWYIGGGRVLGCQIALSAFNHLDIPLFLDFLKTRMPWSLDVDGSCQVLLKDEHDTKFKLYDVFDNEAVFVARGNSRE
jgi:hypothetical protein